MELMASRGYFFCRYCGSFHFPETDGRRRDQDCRRDAGSLACVVCGKPLTSAMLDETHPVRYCRNCRGVLIERRSFAGVVEKRRAWATGTPPPPDAAQSAGARAEGARCPECAGPMTTHPYYGPGQRRDRQLRTLRARLAGLRRAQADRRRAGQGPRCPPGSPTHPRVAEPITGARASDRGCDIAAALDEAPIVRACASDARWLARGTPTPAPLTCRDSLSLFAPFMDSSRRPHPPTRRMTATQRRGQMAADRLPVPDDDFDFFDDRRSVLPRTPGLPSPAQDCRAMAGVPAAGARRRRPAGLQRVSRPRLARAAGGTEERSGADDHAGQGPEPQREAARRARDASAAGSHGCRDRCRHERRLRARARACPRGRNSKPACYKKASGTPPTDLKSLLPAGVPAVEPSSRATGEADREVEARKARLRGGSAEGRARGAQSRETTETPSPRRKAEGGGTRARTTDLLGAGPRRGRPRLRRGLRPFHRRRPQGPAAAGRGRTVGPSGEPRGRRRRLRRRVGLRDRYRRRAICGSSAAPASRARRRCTSCS